MLFRADIEPRCEYCRHGNGMGYDEVACEKRGVFSKYGYCAKFRYDATKRVPERAARVDVSRVSEESFKL